MALKTAFLLVNRNVRMSNSARIRCNPHMGNFPQPDGEDRIEKNGRALRIKQPSVSHTPKRLETGLGGSRFHFTRSLAYGHFGGV